MEAKSLSAKSFGPESSLPLAQWSIAVVYLMKAILGQAWAVAGNAELALEWVTYCLQHPSKKRELSDRAESLRAELVARLTPQQVEAAEARAQVRTLEDLTQEILAAG